MWSLQVLPATNRPQVIPMTWLYLLATSSVFLCFAKGEKKKKNSTLQSDTPQHPMKLTEL